MTSAAKTLGFLVLVAGACGAQQPRPSQRQEILQMLDTTRIRVRYIRPVARGRALFGSLVKYGSMWTPSADSSLWMSFSTDIEVDGHALKAGDYSVWAIPDSTQWTLAFNKSPRNHHTRYPGESQDALRVTAKVDSLPHVETLTIDFPLVDGRNAMMRIHWGPVGISVPLKTN